jgi:hypothetical protein
VTVHLPDGAGSATYPFALSTMEERFLQAGGVEKLYKAFRRELFKAVLSGPKAPILARGGCGDDCGDAAGGSGAKALAW